MKPTKRQRDPLGRSTTRHRYSRYLLSLALAITGSVWPIQARSIEPIFDTGGQGAFDAEGGGGPGHNHSRAGLRCGGSAGGRLCLVRTEPTITRGLPTSTLPWSPLQGPLRCSCARCSDHLRRSRYEKNGE